MEILSSRNSAEQRYWEICTKVVKENALELYDLEYISSNATLRVFIYDPKTKTAVIEDCVKIDRAMTPYLEEDWVADNIILEVSSPGMFRPLRMHEHFDLAMNQMIMCVLAGKVEGIKGNKVRGQLVGFDKNGIKLKINDSEFTLSFENIKKVNLDPDY